MYEHSTYSNQESDPRSVEKGESVRVMSSENGYEDDDATEVCPLCAVRCVLCASVCACAVGMCGYVWVCACVRACVCVCQCVCCVLMLQTVQTFFML